MYKPLHDDDIDRDKVTAPLTSATGNNTAAQSNYHVALNDVSIIDDHGDTGIQLQLVEEQVQLISQRSSTVDGLFGLDENSSVLAKLIILNSQSTPVIVSFVLGLGGDVINFLFAGQFIQTDHSTSSSQILAGIKYWVVLKKQ